MSKVDKYFINRSIFCFLTLTLIIFNTFTNFAVVTKVHDCVLDSFFSYTEGFHLILKHSTENKFILIMLSSILLDCSVIYCCYLWVIKGKSWSNLITVLLFLGLKIIFSVLFMIRHPESALEWNPGVSSLITAYSVSADYFYSGRIGISFLVSTFLVEEDEDKLGKYLGYASFLNTLFISILMISLRRQYSIDIIAAIISAHYFIIIGRFLCEKLKIDEIVSLKQERVNNDNNNYISQ